MTLAALEVSARDRNARPAATLIRITQLVTAADLGLGVLTTLAFRYAHFLPPVAYDALSYLGAAAWLAAGGLLLETILRLRSEAGAVGLANEAARVAFWSASIVRLAMGFGATRLRELLHASRWSLLGGRALLSVGLCVLFVWIAREAVMAMSSPPSS
jgi:hypothetical protein